MMVFRDRADAGHRLAKLLGAYRDAPRAIVLALPRGGVPVGAEVARALNLPLDVLVVRKLGVPGHEEYAAGAIATGGIRVLGEPVYDLSRVLEREQQELARREQAYRGGRAPLDLTGMTVLLVDDGLATGLSMRAAVMAVRTLGAATVVVAVPVGSQSACEALRMPSPAGTGTGHGGAGAAAAHADDIVCMRMPEPFVAVGRWYGAFDPPSDDEVRKMLATPSGAAGDGQSVDPQR
jgi:predicted phosphoribosyltransferase